MRAVIEPGSLSIGISDTGGLWIVAFKTFKLLLNLNCSRRNVFQSI